MVGGTFGRTTMADGLLVAVENCDRKRERNENLMFTDDRRQNKPIINELHWTAENRSREEKLGTEFKNRGS